MPGARWTNGAVGLAHARLSIIDPVGGAQPMREPETGVVIVHNGEVYNFADIRAELQARGHAFRTRSDTEVVLKSYLEWGDDACSHFNGMFAFAIWDPREQTLFLARDRLGIKPLYWTRIGGQLAFASEVKAFMRHPEFVAEADLDGVSSYLTFRQAVWDLSFFKSVHKLLPGHTLGVRGDRLRMRCYWRLPVPRPQSGPGEDAHREAAFERLERAVTRRLIADVPVGAYLSGGLDSGIVAAIMAAEQGTVDTFSVGYEEDGYSEEPYARAVARHIGARHDHLTLSQRDYTDRWMDVLRQNDHPLSIPHEVALHELSAHMKGRVSVALSGEGADELFGGYGRVQRSPMDWKKIAAARALLGPRLSDWLGGRPAFAGTTVEWLRCRSHLDHFFRVYNWIPFEEKWDLFTPDALRVIDGDARTISVFRRIFEDAAAADPYDRVLHVFQKIHLGGLLDRLDMRSMASGLETRVPYVDHELIEYVVHVPHRLKMRWRSPLAMLRALVHPAHRASEWLDVNKYLLRRIGASLLPAEIASRRKLGFPTPLDAWLEQGMGDLARDLLLDGNARTRDIFDRAKVVRLLDGRQRLPYDFFRQEDLDAYERRTVVPGGAGGPEPPRCRLPRR